MRLAMLPLKFCLIGQTTRSIVLEVVPQALSRISADELLVASFDGALESALCSGRGTLVDSAGSDTRQRRLRRTGGLGSFRSFRNSGSGSLGSLRCLELRLRSGFGFRFVLGFLVVVGVDVIGHLDVLGGLLLRLLLFWLLSRSLFRVI